MSSFNFNLPDFNRPVSLIAAGILAIVVIAFLIFWGLSTPWAIVLIGIVSVFLVVGLVFVIKYPQLQLQDEALLEYERERFRDFRGDVTQDDSAALESTEENAERDLNTRRTRIYENNRGLFLEHDWRFSEKPNQVADIIIRLQEHPYTRSFLIEDGKVESVEYELGRRFVKEPVVKRNKEDNFALGVSAYGPMLCVAQVNFNDGYEPIVLSRYIDFPTDPA